MMESVGFEPTKHLEDLLKPDLHNSPNSFTSNIFTSCLELSTD